MSHRLLRITGFLFAIVTLIAAITGCADTVRFGSRSLNVPKPEGFVPVSTVSPFLMQVQQAYLSTTRLIEIYETPADTEALATGKATDPKRWFHLQVIRSLDGIQVSEKTFENTSTQIEPSLEKAFENSTYLNTQLQQGNAETKRMALVDPKIGMSSPEYLGVYRREPWGLFFTLKAHLTAAGGFNQALIAGGAIVLVNHQVLLLYSYSEYHDEKDQQWVKQALSAWADAVYKANSNTIVEQ